MVRHTTSRKKARIQGQHRQPKKKGLGIILAILIIAILAVGFFSNWTFFLTQETKLENRAVAKINDDIIYSNEFEKQWEALPVEAKMQMNRIELLDQMISEKLLLQRAEEEGIIISDAEVDEFITIQLAQAGLTMEQYEGLLRTQGTDIVTMKEMYKRQLSVAKLFDETITKEIDPRTEEIENYYETNKENFYRDEQVTVRHILIQVNENFNDTQAQERTAMIEEELDAANNENFCDLVENYSMDFGSKNLCGEYTFPRGVMVPEFENASFTMDVNERETIRSTFGYHIIIKDENIPESYLGLNDVLVEYPNQPTVQTVINQTLAQEKARIIFEDYVTELFKTATIEYYDAELAPVESTSLKN